MEVDDGRIEFQDPVDSLTNTGMFKSDKILGRLNPHKVFKKILNHVVSARYCCQKNK
jgi:hypothetical protein